MPPCVSNDALSPASSARELEDLLQDRLGNPLTPRMIPERSLEAMPEEDELDMTAQEHGPNQLPRPWNVERLRIHSMEAIPNHVIRHGIADVDVTPFLMG